MFHYSNYEFLLNKYIIYIMIINKPINRRTLNYDIVAVVHERKCMYILGYYYNNIHIRI